MPVRQYTSNINCSGCITRVAALLDSFDGVDRWSVEIEDPQKILTISGDYDEVALRSTLSEIGYHIENLKQ